MAPSMGDRLRHAWNVFTSNEDREFNAPFQAGASYGVRPERARAGVTNERHIVSSIITRMSIDAAAIPMFHVKVGPNNRYLETVKSGLNNCLTDDANVDQTGSALRQDMFNTLLEEGTIAVVATDTDLSPEDTGGYDIKTMRVGRIVQWYPKHVRISLYDEKIGRRKELTLPKSIVAIVENPLYNVMNEQNSTLKRLSRKLALLDAVDEQSSSGKLDLIIQLPYVIRTETRRQQAEQRRKEIEVQMTNSKYGIAYTDGSEKITQLNRPAENNLLKQVEYLTNMLYGQLGITEEVILGTANEETMLGYYTRTIEPILRAVTESMRRTFLTKTARTQGHSIQFYRDPFSLVPVKDLAEIADKFTRNEILTSNEIRGIIGFRPSEDPKADKLINSNMPQPPSVDAGTLEATPIQNPEPPIGVTPIRELMGLPSDQPTGGQTRVSELLPEQRALPAGAVGNSSVSELM